MSRSITSILKSAILAVWVGINVLVALCTLLAAYGGYIPPRIFPLAQLANCQRIALSFVSICSFAVKRCGLLKTYYVSTAVYYVR